MRRIVLLLLCCLFAALMYRSDSSLRIASALPVSKIIGLVTIAFFMLSILTRETSLQTKWIVLLAVLACVRLFSLLVASTEFGAEPDDFISWVQYLILMVLVAESVCQENDIRLLCTALLVSLVLSVISSLPEFQADRSTLNQAGQGWVQARLMGTVGNSGNFGYYLVAGLPIGIYLALFSLKERRAVLALAYGSITIILLLGIVISYSRTAWLLTALALLGIAIRELRAKDMLSRRDKVFVVALIVSFSFISINYFLTVLGLDIDNLMGRAEEFAGIVAGYDNSFYDRTAIQRAAFMLFTEYPLSGVGIGNFRMIAFRYSGLPYHNSAENQYAQMLADSGLPFVFLYFAVLALLIRASLSGPNSKSIWFKMLATSAILVFLFNLTLSMETEPIQYMVAGLLFSRYFTFSRATFPVSSVIAAKNKGETHLARTP